MQCKIKTSKIRILKAIFTDFSRKEKAITRYTRIYIKTKWQGSHKTSKKALFSLWSLNKNSRNVAVSRGEKQ